MIDLLGSNAGDGTDNGNDNVAIGHQALSANAGDDNVAIGKDALLVNVANQNIDNYYFSRQDKSLKT